MKLTKELVEQKLSGAQERLEKYFGREWTEKELKSFLNRQNASGEKIILPRKEYKEFLKEYGAACANGHEFLGICDSKRLDIVDATLEAKKKNELISDEMYLIEDVGIDKILTWQNSDGKLFQSVGKGEPEPIKMNLAEYVDG